MYQRRLPSTCVTGTRVIVKFTDSKNRCQCKNRCQWVQVAKIAGVMVAGDSWAIIVDTQDRANMVNSALGGEIQKLGGNRIRLGLANVRCVTKTSAPVATLGLDLDGRLSQAALP
jgi:hypothetical protein